MNLYFLSLMSFLASVLLFNEVSWSSENLNKQPVASVSFGGEFSSGSYNTENRTNSTYMPLIVSWYPTERIDTSVEIPFIYQSSSQVTTSIYQGSALQTTSSTVARRGGPGMSGVTTLQTGIAENGGGVAASENNTSAVSGVGDIILRAGYTPYFESNFIPQIRTAIFLKTPTASASEGLGTGEIDFGGGFDLSKWFGNLHLAGEATYTYQGKVEGFGLKNYVSYNSTVGYQLTDDLQPMLIIKGATSPSIYSDDLLEARVRLFWNLTQTTALDLFAAKGISESSPDYAGGIAVIYSF